MNMHDTHWVIQDPAMPPKSNENKNEGKMIYGWICPICGKGISPYTSYCNCKYDECYTSTPTSTTTLR